MMQSDPLIVADDGTAWGEPRLETLVSTDAGLHFSKLGFSDFPLNGATALDLLPLDGVSESSDTNDSSTLFYISIGGKS
jgi:hypothetical protein